MVNEEDALGNASNLDQWVRQLTELYKEINFDPNAPRKIVMNLENWGFSNILGIIHALKRSNLESKIKPLVRFLELVKEKFGFFNIVLVDSEIDASSPLKSIRMINLNDFVDKLDEGIFDKLKQMRVILIVLESFWNGLASISAVLNKIWEDGSKIIPVLAWDKRGVFWDLIEGELLIISKFTPSATELFQYFHAYKYYSNHLEGLRKLDELIRHKGLLSRSWGRPRWVLNKIKKFVEDVESRANFEVFVYILNLLLEGKILIDDVYAFLLYLIPSHNKEQKIKYLFDNGILPSDELANVIEGEIELKRDYLFNILKALKIAESTWFPEISIIEIIDLPYGTQYNSSLLETWLKTKFEALRDIEISEFLKKEKIPSQLLPLLKFAIILMTSKIKPLSEVTSLIIRYILSLYNRLKYMAIPIISNALVALQQLDDIEIGIAIYLQRFLEVHGPEPYIQLTEAIFGDKSILIPFLGLLVNSSQGIGPRKILAMAVKSDKIIKAIRKYLVVLNNFKPRGFTAPLPWEMELKFSEKVERRLNASIHYFEELGLVPPLPMINLEKAISIEKDVENLLINVRNIDFDAIIDSTIKKITAEGAINSVKDYLSEYFGNYDVRLIRSLESRLDEVSRKIGKEFERRFVSEYKNLLEKYSFVAEAINKAKEIIGENKPIILFVIDGLRLDDYISKLKPLFKEKQLEIVLDSYLFSFLPSITTYSRRSIFSGEKPPKTLAFPLKTAGFSLTTEEEYLIKRFPNSMYIKGSLGEINSKLKSISFSEKLKGVKVIAFVMSDLEKAAHGSAEGFLAHMTMDYAMEIANTIKNAIISYYEVNKVVPYIILVSDHGLEKFTKVTEFSPRQIVRVGRDNGYLDPSHEELITPRYMIVPCVSPEKTKLLILRLPKEIRESIWAVTGSELGMEKVAVRMRNESYLELVDAEKVLFIFPRGDRRFKVGPTRSVVYHGGALPSEIIVPFVILTAK